MSAAPQRLYVDTSAYLCVLLGETGSASIAAELMGARLLSSSLLVLEAHRNLVRMARAGELTSSRIHAAQQRLEEDLRTFELRDLTLDLCRAREMPAVSTPRSLDLAHLRTALWFHARKPLTRFVSLDAAQVHAAGELGLPI